MNAQRKVSGGIRVYTTPVECNFKVSFNSFFRLIHSDPRLSLAEVPRLLELGSMVHAQCLLCKGFFVEQ